MFQTKAFNNLIYILGALTLASCSVKMNRDEFLKNAKGAAVSMKQMPQVVQGGSTASLSLDTTAGDGAIKSQLIEFAADGVNFSSIANFTTLTQTYAWKIPTVNTTASVLRYTVIDQNNVSVITTSDPFSVDSISPTLAITAPAAGASFMGGNASAITYTTSDLHLGTTPIAIDYSTNSGSTWISITNGTANTGSYSWAPPLINSSTVKIRVTSTDGVGNSTSAVSGLININSGTPIVTITTPTMVNVINSYTTLNPYTVSGTCSENGQPVTVAVTDGSTTVHPAVQPTCNTSATPNYTTTVNLSSLADGTITFKADHVSTGGTAATQATVAVTKDIQVPTLASATVTNPSPTNSTTYNLTYGAQAGGTYSSYCILENSTVVGSCSWTAGSLPSTYTVTGTNNAKVLSIWIEDAVGNVSTRVDTNSVTLDTSTLSLASVTVTNASPTNSTTYNLTYGIVTGTYNSYCILENSTTIGSCSWTAGTLPASFTVSATNNAKILSVWIKNAANTTSTRVDSNSVTLDTVTPTLASATITNSSPTSSTTYNLTYGAITDTYSTYCILENSTTIGSCSWTAGTLPASYVVTSTNNAKVLSIWIKDAATNVSTRVDTNSVTLNTSTPTVTITTPVASSIINASSTITSYTVSGACSENGRTVTVAVTDGTVTVNPTTQPTCTSLAYSTTVNLTTLADGTITFKADHSNAAGTNATQASVTATKDVQVPTLASATVTNSSPTSSTTYNLTYGAQGGGTYASYCILENSTTVGSCSWTTGTLPASYTVTGTNNAKVLSIWIKDAAANVSTRIDTNSVTLDTSTPALASVTVTNTSPTNTTTYNLTYGTVTGAYASYCILENLTTIASCSWTAGTLPATFTVSTTNNAKVLSVWIKNSAGTTSTEVDSNSVTLDTVTPTLASATITNSSPTSSTTYNLTYGAITDTYASYCILENSTTVGSCSWTAGTLPASYVVTTTNNAKVLSVWIKDAATNVSTRVDTNSVTLNTGTPTVTISTPAMVSVVNSTSALTAYTVSGACSENGRTVTVAVTDGTATVNPTTQPTCTTLAYTTTVNISSLADGTITFKADHSNAAGTNATQATVAVTKDVQVPTLASATVTNTSPTNSTTYNLTYGTQAGGTYASYCILENSTTVGSCTWNSGTLPASVVVSSTNNAKVLSVWIQDSAGNVSTRVDTNSVTLDTSTPALASVTVTNTSPTNSTTYNLTYGTVTGAYASYCILENLTTVGSCSWTAGTLPATYTVTSTNNAKVLSVWIKNTAGTSSTRVDSNSVTLDTVTPTLASATITNSSPTSSTTYNLTYGAVTDTYSTYCILENSTTVASCSWTAGTLPATYVVTSTNNAKVLSIWIQDSATNISTRVDTNSVTLNTSTPTVTITTPAASSVINASSAVTAYTVAGACSENGRTVTVAVTDGTLTVNPTTQPTCTSLAYTTTVNLSTLADGTITFKADHTNAAGTAATQASVTAVKDVLVPTLASATVTNTSPTSSTTYNLTYGAQAGGTYASYCILENSTTVGSCSWTAGTLPASYTVTGTNNAKVLSVWIKDAAANVSTRVDTNSVTLDTSTPALASVTITNASPTNTTTYNLTYGTVTGAYASYCILENLTTIASCSWTAGTLPATFTVSTTNNAKVLSVWIKNSAGTTSTEVDSNSVTLDTVTPTLASATITNTSPTASTTYNLTYGAITDTYASYCILENSTTVGSCSWTAGTLPASYTVTTTNNAKVLSVWIKDAATNVSTRVDTNSVTLNTGTPTVTITTPTAVNVVNASSAVTAYTVSGACSENGRTVTVAVTDGTLTVNPTTQPTCTTLAYTTTVNLSTLADGTITFKADHTNAAGTAATQATVAVVKDVLVPTLASATVTNTSPTNSTTYNLTYGAQAGGTYATYCILENSTTVGSCSWTSGTLPATYTVTGTNNAKVLSVWIQDAHANVSTRVDTNSVTLDTSTPALASVTVTNATPTNSTTYNLTYGTVTGAYAKYCILENSTTVGSCSWTAGTLPSTYTVTSTNNAKVLSVWIQNSAGTNSTRVDSNSVTLDTVTPTLASATITNTSPTSSTTYNLTYGAITDTYSNYCILENSTTVGSCSWTAGTLPASYVVTTTNNAKVLSVWIKDSATNVSTRVDTNSVTLNTSTPTVTITSPAMVNVVNSTSAVTAYTVSGACSENGRTVTVAVTDGTTTVNPGTQPTCTTLAYTTTVNLSTLSDGTITFKADHTNAAGTAATQATVAVVKDVLVPTLASATVTNSSPTNSTTYNLTYGAQAGGTYASYCILENSTTVGSCSWTNGTLPATYTVTSTNNAKVLSVWIQDAHANVSTRVDTNSVTLNTSTPTVTITSPAMVNVVNSTSAVTAYTVTGACSENGRSVVVTVTDGTTTVTPTSQPNCTSLAYTTTVNLTTLADGTITFKADHSNAAGTAATQASVAVVKDVSVPTLASATVTNSSPTTSTTYNLTYGTQAGGTYASYCILENSTTVGSCSWTNGTLPTTFTVNSTNNAKVLSVWIQDSHSNVSTRVDTNSVTLSTGPTPPTALTLNTPTVTPACSSTPIINVAGVTSGDTVKIYSDSSCTTLKGTATAAGTSVNVTSSALTAGAYTFYATTTTSGSTSACSTASVAYTYQLPVVNLYRDVFTMDGANAVLGQAITVVRDVPGCSETVSLTSDAITALSTSQFTASTQTVTFAATDSSVTVANSTFTPVVTTTVKGDNFFRIKLSAPSVGTVGTTYEAMVNMLDSKLTENFFFMKPLYSGLESDGNISVLVGRSGSTAAAASVNITFIDGTAFAGTDYNNTTLTANFAINSAETTVSIPVTNRSGYQANRSFYIELNSPSTGTSNRAWATAKVRILDVDTPPVACNATLTSGFGGGAGTIGSPYLICNLRQLYNVRTPAANLTKYYQVVADIDLDPSLDASGSSTAFVPCTGTFTGVFDGNERILKNFRYSSSSTSLYYALFNAIGGSSTVQMNGINLIQSTVVNTSTNTASGAGTIVGKVTAAIANLSNNMFSGYVSGKNAGGIFSITASTLTTPNIRNFSHGLVSSAGPAGGIYSGVTNNSTNSDLSYCYSTANVKQTSTSPIGGLFSQGGNTTTTESIAYSHAKGMMIGGTTGAVGGLVGTMTGSGSNTLTISNSFSTSKIYNGDNTGGLVGLYLCPDSGSTCGISSAYATGSVTNSQGYVNVGGLVGKLANTGYNYTVNNVYATGAVNTSGSNTNTGGLFGTVNLSITLTMTNVSASGNVTATGGSAYTGGLAGSIETYLTNQTFTLNGAHASGAISGTSQSGGLIGYLNVQNSSSISMDSDYATGNLIAGFAAGGLIGSMNVNSSTGKTVSLTNSYATGNISGSSTSSGYGGGLINEIDIPGTSPTITLDSNYATGNVTAGSNNTYNIGGLIGQINPNSGGNTSPTLTVSNSYASGTVTGFGTIGGVIGNVTDGSALNGTYNFTNLYNTAPTVVGIYQEIGGVFGAITLGNSGNNNSTFNITGCHSPSAVTTSNYHSGGFVGHIYTQGTGSLNISTSYATGAVFGAANVGGFVGYLEGDVDLTGTSNVTFTKDYATGNIGTGNDANYQGGFVGNVYGNHNGTKNYKFQNCYATGNVLATTVAQYIGGFMGQASGSIGGASGNTGILVQNSFATGQVSGNNYVGGFVGYGSSNAAFTNDYTVSTSITGNGNLGGFVGYAPSINSTDLFNETSIYWLKDTGINAGLTSDGNQKTATQMKTTGTYSGWDFSTVWNAPTGSSYPTLR